MKVIRTLSGDVRAEQFDVFGVIDFHEHLVASPPVAGAADEDLSLCDTDKMTQELCSFADAGGVLLVDASISDFGEKAHIRKAISEAAGVPAVGTVGFGQKEHHSEQVRQSTTEELYARVMDAARRGYGPHRLRPGQLKFGTSYQRISPSEERCARAVARAQRDTGLPLFTHTGIGTMALEQIGILRAEGAALEHVCIGHMDRNPDLWLYREILKNGVYLGIDQISKVKYQTEEIRIELIIELIRAGYGKRLLLGGDLARRSYLKAFGGGPGFEYIPGQFLPRLARQMRESGFTGRETENAVRDLAFNNPREYLSIEAEGESCHEKDC